MQLVYFVYYSHSMNAKKTCQTLSHIFLILSKTSSQYYFKHKERKYHQLVKINTINWKLYKFNN